MSRPPIVVERVIAAPPEVVFAAWGDAASLRAWMLPGSSMTGASVEADFRVGGSFRIAMHDRERDYLHRGEYLEIAPPERIVMTWISEWMPAGIERSLLRVDIEAAGAGRTRIVLTHDELPDAPSYDGHPAGWAEILAKLAARLEAVEEGRPRPDRA